MFNYQSIFISRGWTYSYIRHLPLQPESCLEQWAPGVSKSSPVLPASVLLSGVLVILIPEPRIGALIKHRTFSCHSESYQIPTIPLCGSATGPLLCLPPATLPWAHQSQAWSTPGIAPQHHGLPSWQAHPWNAAHGSWETYTECYTLLGGPSHPCFYPGHSVIARQVTWRTSLEILNHCYHLETCHLKGNMGVSQWARSPLWFHVPDLGQSFRENKG